MKIENRQRTKAKKGAEVKSYLERKDAQVKSMRATTSGVAEGKLSFPENREDWQIVPLEWTGRDGIVRDYPAVICVDSKGEEHAIALSAFRAKDEVVAIDGTTITCQNLVEFDADYNSIWEALQTAQTIRLHRVVGRRNGRKGRYEFFTTEQFLISTKTSAFGLEFFFDATLQQVKRSHMYSSLISVAIRSMYILFPWRVMLLT